MTRYKVLSGRLVVGNDTFLKDEIIDEKQLPKNNLDILVGYKSLVPINEKVIEAKVVVPPVKAMPLPKVEKHK